MLELMRSYNDIAPTDVIKDHVSPADENCERLKLARSLYGMGGAA